MNKMIKKALKKNHHGHNYQTQQTNLIINNKNNLESGKQTKTKIKLICKSKIICRIYNKQINNKTKQKNLVGEIKWIMSNK